MTFSRPRIALRKFRICASTARLSLPGIVTVVADFPAHCLFPPEGVLFEITRRKRSRFLRAQQCAHRLKAAQQARAH